MDRKEFLAHLGLGSAAVFMGACLAGCGKEGATPARVDFTLDLSAPANAALNTPGGYVYNQGVIVARTQQNAYIAVSQACTHEGTSVQFQGANNRFYCPNHGATFSVTGTVTGGPANRPLTQYNTQLTGTTLRVFS